MNSVKLIHKWLFTASVLFSLVTYQGHTNTSAYFSNQIALVVTNLSSTSSHYNYYLKTKASCINSSLLLQFHFESLLHASQTNINTHFKKQITLINNFPQQLIQYKTLKSTKCKTAAHLFLG